MNDNNTTTDTQVQVTFTDNRDPETVTVRRTNRSQYPQLAQNLGTDEQEAAYHAGKSVEWAGALSDESLDAVIAAGRKLSWAGFGSWFARRQQVLNLLGNHLSVATLAAVDRIPNIKTV
jgi:hypothetical protein